ncbi:MAG: glycolate oxidase subunit GlcF [Betaproteobacteria bacterium]|nr:glycolate oxidase subunit GlcF [Betaproteobacteria bacterium]
MQTRLADFIKDTPDGREAESILRACVHCGFCTATCPTYQIRGDELDGPRGRIYLMKQMLEGAPVTARTQLHLDRCLTCHSCETTCPSGVRYGHLVDIGRKLVSERVERPTQEKLQRWVMATFFRQPATFRLALGAGMALRPFLPEVLRAKLPASLPRAGAWPPARHQRRFVSLAGCAQPVLTPNTNAAAARVLDRVGISLIDSKGCCGALRFHLDYQEDGLSDMRRIIDTWWPHVEQGVEGFAMTATGCGSTVREYGHHLQHDRAYAEKAERISTLTQDLTEVIAGERALIRSLLKGKKMPRVAFHPPCTLQHWQKLRGLAEDLLRSFGYELTPIADAHLCCGSAGTYAITQPELSEQLKRNKVAALEAERPELILTANMGCETHLATIAGVPVKHWIVDLDERLSD